MSKIILTSEVTVTGSLIAKELAKPASEYQVLFIITAAEGEPGGINEEFVKNDRKGLVEAGFNLTDYTITGKTEAEIRSEFQKYDIVFVNGGNTYYLLQKMQIVNFERLIKEYLDNGGIYASSSAGSIVAGMDISPAQKIEGKLYDLDSTKGLGLVDFVVLPHWGSDEFRELYLNKRLDVAYQSDYPVLLLTDNSFVVVEDGRLRVISPETF